MKKSFEMRKRVIRGSVPVRSFTNLVLESFGKGSTVEEIVDDLRLKHREWARWKRQILLVKVKNIVNSRSNDRKHEDESSGSRKKQRRDDLEQRNSDLCISSPSSGSSSGNVLTSDDNMQFDITNDSLRLSYSDKSKASEEASKGSYDVEVKGPNFKDLGGLNGILDKLAFVVKLPLLCPDIVQAIGMKPISGFLLHGPPGCGKSTLACAIANETGVPFYMISAAELVSGVSGESEENIRELFFKAYRTAPSIIFIDEIDAIASKRENQQKGMDTRILTQLLSCMDDKYMLLKHKEKNVSSGFKPGHVVVIGATNRPDALDPALRRSLRFDREICLGVPDQKAREEIFSVATRGLTLDSNFDRASIASLTSGFVGADFDVLAKEAGMVLAQRIIYSRKSGLCTDIDSLMRQPISEEERKQLVCTTSDFMEALKEVQPTLTREGFSTKPNVTWDDVGGLDNLKQEFYEHVIRPLKFPEQCKGFEFCLETGFLLFGPPGVGKTLVAQAVANEAGANYIHVEGPELLSKYVGDTEKAIRELFSRARRCSPCIVFFDEVDALTSKRGEQGAWVVERSLIQLLAELSGGKKRGGVIVIAATNRPDRMDPAVQRAGRFGRLFYVTLPNAAQRFSILKSLVRGITVPIDPTVDLNAIAERCENCSGADLKSLVNRAAFAAYRDTSSTSKRIIKMDHFEQSLSALRPSLTIQQLREYEEICEKFDEAAK
ncbi:ATPase AAA-type core [Arabidopsis suecica]|uniref:ATPase AAA-type core n=1 Tax=Arabidopsis suecica TaxID=45249 RepID=A0A8T2BAR0_ARASU|nr:ATPase AAA-type core [Arabidopsis suecica]